MLLRVPPFLGAVYLHPFFSSSFPRPFIDANLSCSLQNRLIWCSQPRRIVPQGSKFHELTQERPSMPSCGREARRLSPEPPCHLCVSRLHRLFLASGRFFVRAAHPTNPRPLGLLSTTRTPGRPGAPPPRPSHPHLHIPARLIPQAALLPRVPMPVRVYLVPSITCPSNILCL
ncbi:hypothetical protein DFH08DRAFT_871129 [Mycena albidolilacea]|uniref:Uncharacterized protein n=1 Tax=Mycena albidolilacea TaxID=1033008 RepID=A0AAD7A0D1_9AGAR|nr:hypothetical protein DFH08DRAFT_871129 [Mycena albidolilacea]